MKPLADLMGSNWIPNELFEVEHYYTVVAKRTLETGDVTYMLSKRDFHRKLTVGHIFIPASTLRKLFVRTQDNI